LIIDQLWLVGILEQGKALELVAEGIEKSFGGQRAVDGMSLTLGAGEILGIIGPNGAGKTTLFNLLAGTLRMDSGNVLLGDTDLTTLPPQSRIKSGLGRTFQIPRPFSRMTVLENVMTAAQNQTGERLWATLLTPSTVKAEERANVAKARELLDFVSLSHLEDQQASVLSGGQRKLLELARVLMADPIVILLDDPAAGGNPALLDLIIDRISEINKRGIGILLIEHNMEMIARLCPRVIVMAAGQLLAEGAPEDVAKRADVIDVYLEGMPA